jgi:hypothetical protein
VRGAIDRSNRPGAPGANDMPQSHIYFRYCFLIAAISVATLNDACSQPASAVPPCPPAALRRDCCPPDARLARDQHGQSHFIGTRYPETGNIEFYAYSILGPNTTDPNGKHSIRHSICSYHAREFKYWWRDWQGAEGPLLAGQCSCTPWLRPNGAHDQIGINTRGYIKFRYTNRDVAAYYFEPVSDHPLKVGDAADTITQSVGVLFEEENKINLEHIEFASYWSGRSIEARISSKTSRFIVALEFSPQELNWLNIQAGSRPSESTGVSTSIDTVTGLITDRAAKESLSDELLRTKFLILDPKRQEFNHRIFAAEVNSAKERIIPTLVLSRSGKILESTAITMYLPD